MNRNVFCTKEAIRKLHTLVASFTECAMTPRMMSEVICVGLQSVYTYVHYLEELGIIEKSHRVNKSWYYKGTGKGTIPEATPHGNNGKLAAKRVMQKAAGITPPCVTEPARSTCKPFRDWLQIAFFGHGPAPSLRFRQVRITIAAPEREEEPCMA